MLSHRGYASLAKVIILGREQDYNSGRVSSLQVSEVAIRGSSHLSAWFYSIDQGGGEVLHFPIP